MQCFNKLENRNDVLAEDGAFNNLNFHGLKVIIGFFPLYLNIPRRKAKNVILKY